MAVPEEARREVGAVICAARGGKSQTWLGKQVGVHQTTISKWEGGEVVPPLDKLTALERALPGVKGGQLVAIVYGNQPPPHPPALEHLGAALDELLAMRAALDRLEDSIRDAMR